MAYTLGEAAKASGFSKPTLSRAIKGGKLTAKRLEDGSYQIDPAELARWNDSNGHRNRGAGRLATPEEPPEEPGREPERAAERAEVATLRALVSRMDDEVKDLRARLDAEAEERRRLVAMLIGDQRPASRSGPWRGLLAWLRGEGGRG